MLSEMYTFGGLYSIPQFSAHKLLSLAPFKLKYRKFRANIDIGEDFRLVERISQMLR